MISYVKIGILSLIFASSCQPTSNSLTPDAADSGGASSVVDSDTNTEQPVPTDDADDQSSDTPVTNPVPTSLRPLSLNANDVSILFPAPRNADDLANKTIRLSTDFKVFPQNVFDQTMRIATGPSTLTIPNGAITIDAGLIPDTTRRIKFPGTNRREDWAVAGIRIDPGAPGLTKEVFDVFGKSPQIRLILQPVNLRGSGVEVTDGSLHLVYAFHEPKDLSNACRLHNIPDTVGFSSAVDDLIAIKARFASTAGRPLGVHPAFAAPGSAYRDALAGFLEEHLTTDRLFAVSMAGIPLPNPEPWVFIAMQNHPITGDLEAIPSPAVIQPGPLPKFGQMISFIDSPQIVPAPATRNLSPVDCRMNAPGAVPSPVPGAGVATATVFDNGDPNISFISSVIADPARSHFFNTDCVSCHTETRKEIDRGAASRRSIALQADIDPTALPESQWNVRAFGWFPGFPARPTAAHETVVRRTANETKEVVECFATGRWALKNEHCLP